MRIQNLSYKLEVEQDKTDKLTNQISNLNDSYKKFSEDIKNDISSQKIILEILNSDRAKNTKELEELRKKFNQSSSGERRNLDLIIENKPTLLERRINDATKKVGEEIENSTNYTN
jgi:ribosomal protein L16 Arg81 hydroxylase